MPPRTKKPTPPKASVAHPVKAQAVSKAPVIAAKPPSKAARKPVVKPAKPRAKVTASPPAIVELPVATPPVATPIAAAPEPSPLAVAPVIPAPAKLTLVPAVEQAAAYQPPAVMATVFKGYEDFAAFGKDNFDAFVKANTIFVKGIEHFGKEMMSLTQANMKNAASLTQAIFSAKTLNDMVELNTELTTSSIEELAANSSKLSEIGMKLTTEALAPINARVNAAIEKMLELSTAA